MISFNVIPITLAAGLSYALMSLTVWSLLRRTPHARAVRFWSAGLAVGGIGLMLVATRGVLPNAMGYGLTAWLAGVALVLQVHALRVQIGLPSRALQLTGLWLLSAAINAATVASGQLELHAAISGLMLAITAAVIGWHASLAALHNGSRSAMLVAWSQWALMLALLIRATCLLLGWSWMNHPLGGLDYALLYITTTLAALYGNLGFVGMVLDITRRAEAQAREAAVAETTRREAAETHALALTRLLHQRDRLASERERLLHLLAHEIRQPLHNASGALQAAGQVLKATQSTSIEQVAQRLGRAEAVLGRVRSVLDNTLAAATLLGRSTPLALQDVDLDFLIDLALGDLEEGQRQQVQLQWHSDLRLAECEPGLLRLALRNLLLNAFAHGGPGVQVWLRIEEQAQPPAVLLSVIDDGPGAPTDRLWPVSDSPHPGPADGPERPPLPADVASRGLGLQIVRQVMALHGGSLAMAAHPPRGLKASLVLPLPAA